MLSINNRIAEELGVRPQQVAAAVALLDEGSTVPFISRYRKEVTGSLDDERGNAVSGVLRPGGNCSRTLASLGVAAVSVDPIRAGSCGIAAPVEVASLDGGAVKLSAKADPDDVLRLIERLDPEREPGRLSLITRMGAGRVADALPGREFTGSVDRVAPVVDTGTGTFRVVATFAGDGELQPGMFTRLGINYDQRADALVVPRTALLEDGGEPAVYVVRDGKAARSALKLGYDEAGWVEVREGLQAGDAVVVAGKAALREGSAVQVRGQDKDKSGRAATQAATR